METKAQGRVVINEYLPWPSNSCAVTSEFVELYNFGPGPVNIGCYVLTEGDYSITIPANTVLLPGEYYVIAGMDVLPLGCGNISNAVPVQLNWNTCNCTSAPIPNTGDGLFTDGGGGSEQVVLLDPSGNVVDAVVRSLPAETSSPITTSTSGGGCTAFTFDLDNMAITYEVLGMSTGRGNTFARLLDGDCGWVKETQQSAGASNNTSGDNSSMTASLTVTQATACPNTGAAEVEVFASNYSGIFPMSYTLEKDADNDLQYTTNDIYVTGTDNSVPTVPVTGLTEGRYRMVVASSMGCDLKSFNFVVLACNAVLNPGISISPNPSLETFRLSSGKGAGNMLVQWPASKATYRLLVYNFMGQQLHSEKITVSKDGVFQHNFPVNTTASGIFLLSLERTDGVPEKYIRRFMR